MFKLIQNGFIFDDPIPVPECHASTILKTGKAKAVRMSTLDAICRELHCQPGDLLEYVEDDDPWKR